MPGKLIAFSFQPLTDCDNRLIWWRFCMARLDAAQADGFKLHVSEISPSMARRIGQKLADRYLPHTQDAQVGLFTGRMMFVR